jgi:hypothetical protein
VDDPLFDQDRRQHQVVDRRAGQQLGLEQPLSIAAVVQVFHDDACGTAGLRLDYIPVDFIKARYHRPK